MTTKLKFVAAIVTLCAASAASATVLTFDNLNTQYGDGLPLGASMTQTSTSLSYTENGFVLTLHTPTPLYANGTHIGDAGGSSNFNWHDDGDNGTGAYVTLTAANGGLFNLASFNYVTSAALSVAATGYSTANLSGSGAKTLNFNNVSSVRFSSTNYTFNQLDNITVNAVPEPGSLALIALGLLGGGFMRRKVSKK